MSESISEKNTSYLKRSASPILSSSHKRVSSGSSSPHPAMSISSLLSSNHPPYSPISEDTYSTTFSSHFNATFNPSSTSSHHKHLSLDDTTHAIKKLITESNSRPVSCRVYHAIVAQKSYGTEKRFICPPPIVKADPTFRGNLSISVVCQGSGPSLEQQAHVENGMAAFRYLHVSGTSKAKSFELQLSDETSPSSHSQPISIISKPSKKSLKTRNPHSTIYSGSTISLFSRINSQTVRTNYLTIDNHDLSVTKDAWIPFYIHRADHSSGPIHYGDDIVLSDVDHSGYRSPPMQMCRVDRGQVVESNGPVSQMHKIALRLTGNQFLSSSLVGSQLGLVSPHGDLSVCLDDRVIWTIVGIGMFDHTISASPGLSSCLPCPPLSQLAPPRLDANNGLLELTLFDKSVNIWIGWWGPLPTQLSPSSNRLSVSLPNPSAVINHMSCSHPLTDPYSTVQTFSFPLLATDHNGTLFSLGSSVEMTLSRANPIYSHARYTRLV